MAGWCSRSSVRSTQGNAYGYTPDRRGCVISATGRYSRDAEKMQENVICSGGTVKISIGVLIPAILQTPPLCFRDRHPLGTASSIARQVAISLARFRHGA